MHRITGAIRPAGGGQVIPTGIIRHLETLEKYSARAGKAGVVKGIP